MKLTSMCKMTARMTAIAAFSVPLFATLAAAQDVDFKGKTVEIVVPAAPGGGTDVWARFWAPRIQKHLPGQPTVLILNQPGGGQITGGNAFAANAKPDGLMLFASSGTGHFAYLLGDRRVKYDLSKVRTVLASPVGGLVMVRGDLGVSGPQDLEKLVGKKLKYGSQGATSQDLLSFYAFEQLGMDVDAIMGMRGRNDARLAFERGELTIDYQNSFLYDDQLEPLIKEGKAVSLFTFGAPGQGGDIVRDPIIPDTPTYAELYETKHGKKPDGLEWEVYRSFFTAGYGAQKLLNLPEGTPDAIVQTYVKAIEAAMAEPDYQNSIETILGPYKQFVGDEAEQLKEQATHVSPQAKEAVLKWLKERFNADVE